MHKKPKPVSFLVDQPKRTIVKCLFYNYISNFTTIAWLRLAIFY